MPGEGFEPSRAGAHEFLKLARLPDFAIPAQATVYGLLLALRTDEGIQDGYALPPGDGDELRPRVSMPHAYRIARISEDLQDVLRKVREEVARVLILTTGNTVDHPAPVGWMSGDIPVSEVEPQ